MDKELKIGDIVRFKSGGPKMLVTDANSKGWLWCHWFDKDGIDRQAYFKPEHLKPVK